MHFSGASAGITLDIDAATLQAATATGNLQLTGVFEDVTGSGFDDCYTFGKIFMFFFVIFGTPFWLGLIFDDI